ncbi:MAG: zinc ribbon domain-containing protein [Deltaproteobacteria bacterium]|nr:MAG: zinc ribbon domain-containing protein [Deltaproteobacteria bacterium]
MPTYEYVCEANGQSVEVKHSINDKLLTWGELCERANVEPGDTPSEAPVARKIFGGQLMLKKGGNGLVYPKKGDPLHAKAHSCCGGGSCTHG